MADKIRASEGINSTEFIEFLEDDRIEEFQVQPTAGVYEITGQLRKGQEIEIEDDQNVNFFGSGEQKTLHLLVPIY